MLYLTEVDGRSQFRVFREPIMRQRVKFCFPKRVLQSLDFTISRVLMKLFKSSNIMVIEQCRYFFHIELPSASRDVLRIFFGKFFYDDKVYQCLMSVICSALLIVTVIFVITVFFSFFYVFLPFC